MSIGWAWLPVETQIRNKHNTNSWDKGWRGRDVVGRIPLRSGENGRVQAYNRRMRNSTWQLFRGFGDPDFIDRVTGLFISRRGLPRS